MFRFGDCEVDPARREVRRGGELQHLEPQAFDLLMHLIGQRDRVVPKRELLDGVWGHHFLSEANLTTRVKEARRAVGDDGMAQHTIHNVRGRGYRFVAELELDASSPSSQVGHRSSAVELVGRSAELAEVVVALAEAPLVTLVGPGGVGKSALARVVMAQPAVRRPGGAHFVDLAAIDPGSDVLAAVAAALNVWSDPARAAATLATIARFDALVVLDNSEHVAAAAAAMVDRVLAVPDRVVRFVATSRVRLGLGEERVVAIAPLSPEEARELFVRRATSARPGWDVLVDGGERVDELLAGLDRLPLTIEMAAARLGSMTFDDVSTALLGGAPMLQVSHRTPSHRHRSLDSLVSWSVDLLDLEQQALFADLAVFAGSVGAADVGAVTGAGAGAGPLLADLADRSLLAPDLSGRASSYRMLVTVKAIATARFETTDRAREMRRRHAEHFTAAAVDADRVIRGCDEAAGRARFASIVPELRVACSWAAEHDPRVADRLLLALQLQSYSTFWSEPEEWAAALLARYGDVELPGARLMVAGAAANRGELATARTIASSVLTDPNPAVRATGHEILADVAIYSGHHDAVRAHCGELTVLAASRGDEHQRAIAMVDLALGETFMGDPARGLALLDVVDADGCSMSDCAWLAYARGETLAALRDRSAIGVLIGALELAAAAGNPFVSSVSQLALAAEHARAGNLDQALPAYADCLRGHLRHGNHTHAVTVLRNLAGPLVSVGDDELAVRLLAAAGTIERDVQHGAETEHVAAVTAAVRARVGEARFDSWWADGERLPFELAVREAEAAVARAAVELGG